MLAPVKLMLATLCLLVTITLYGDFNSSPARDVVLAQPNTSDTTAPSSNRHGDAISDPSAIPAPRQVPKILQATMMFGHRYKGLNERTLQSHADHAKRWGYGNHVLTREIVGAGAVEGEGVWDKYIFSKILYLLRIMTMELEKPREERAEWIVWYDADTLIMNPNVPWETFLPPTGNDSLSDIKFLATKDVSGFNAGLFFCRVDEWMIDALTDSYALPRSHPEIDIGGNIEQNAMKYIFGKAKNKKHVVYQPAFWYNWFSSIDRPDSETKGDMAIHFSGINHDDEGNLKKSIMETWFGKLQSAPAAWQVPLEKTRYPKEVPVFWELLREGREILSIVQDRGDTGTGEIEHGIQIARNELKWVVEEEAYDNWKLNRVIQELIEALRQSENPEELALLEVYGEEAEVAETSAQRGAPDTDPAAASQDIIAQEAISSSTTTTSEPPLPVDDQASQQPQTRFSRHPVGADMDSAKYG